jgi:hypothetical protein
MTAERILRMGKAHTIKSENVARDLLRKLGPVVARQGMAVTTRGDARVRLVHELVEKAAPRDSERIARNLLRRLGPAPDIREVVSKGEGPSRA